MYPCADPLFYLHHSMLDKIWWQWQNANRTQRLREIEGPLGGEASQLVRQPCGHLFWTKPTAWL